MLTRMEDIQVGAVAPDFTLPDVDGNPVTLSGLRGKYVLIDFWASWCPDCRKENPNIVAAWNKYKDKNFTILGVSLDRKKEPCFRLEGLEIGCSRAVCYSLDSYEFLVGPQWGDLGCRIGRGGFATKAG